MVRIMDRNRMAASLAALFVTASLVILAEGEEPTAANVQLDPAIEAKLKNLEQTVDSIGRQLMQQQTFVEERIRSDGMSGVKSIRHNHEGTSPYFGDTHIGGHAALACHDHADYDRTIGLGEFVGVMNGVEFRTRHNDYRFAMPSRNKNYDEVEDIPFPRVPDAVLNKETIQEQIDEMRLWFKAFKDQDYSVRDYRKYFKPNLCYLEGAWTLNSKTLKEPFASDRHHIDADSWFDLQDKIRWTSYTGSKSNLENFAFLPTILYNISNGVPQYAQWNYRILCHPLSQDVRTSHLKLQDDLAHRLSRKMRWNNMDEQKSARYKLNEFGTERSTKWTLLDDLMMEIPGKENYGTNFTDDSLGLNLYKLEQGNVPLNSAHYHRWYKVTQKGAMGLQVHHRGFRDENLWVAFTNQPNIMPLTIKRCSKGKCEWETKRVTYAIPLEIVYATPLSSWNPYDLDYHKESDVHKNGRHGDLHNKDKAYNGTSFRHYYRTPVEFFAGAAGPRDPADTARKGVGVLDKQGNLRVCAASGFHIFTQAIEGVGPVRTRYPIFPVHSEGSTVGEELQALKRMVMRMSKYMKLYEELPLGQALPIDEDVQFQVRDSHKNPPGLHGHDFMITESEHNALLNGTSMHVTTSFNVGHNHELEIYYNKNNHKYYIKTCDGLRRCWDDHSPIIDRIRI